MLHRDVCPGSEELDALERDAGTVSARCARSGRCPCQLTYCGCSTVHVRPPSRVWKRVTDPDWLFITSPRRPGEYHLDGKQHSDSYYKPTNPDL